MPFLTYPDVCIFCSTALIKHIHIYSAPTSYLDPRHHRPHSQMENYPDCHLIWMEMENQLSNSAIVDLWAINHPAFSINFTYLLSYLHIIFIYTQMQAEIQVVSSKPKLTHVLSRTWQQFTDRAMDLLVQNPTTTKYVLKYVPKTHKFVLKVTDGTRMIIKKCSAQELIQVQKFTVLAGRALTNEGNKKDKANEDTKGEDKKKGNKKNKKR